MSKLNVIRVEMKWTLRSGTMIFSRKEQARRLSDLGQLGKRRLRFVEAARRFDRITPKTRRKSKRNAGRELIIAAEGSVAWAGRSQKRRN